MIKETNDEKLAKSMKDIKKAMKERRKRTTKENDERERRKRTTKENDERE
jgi:hypothetical protein